MVNELVDQEKPAQRTSATSQYPSKPKSGRNSPRIAEVPSDFDLMWKDPLKNLVRQQEGDSLLNFPFALAFPLTFALDISYDRKLLINLPF